MTFSAHSRPPSTPGLELPIEEVLSPPSIEELVFIQEATGRYWSFHWGNAGQYNLSLEQILTQGMEGPFAPLRLEAYLHRIEHVLASRSPEQFGSYFRCGDQTILLDLVMGPVLRPDEPPIAVVVTGRVVSVAQEPTVAAGLDMERTLSYPSLALSSDRYQKLLTKIAWNIRRTLDLPTIWQQTVEGLGRALNVSRCIVCPYERQAPTVQAVAEYCQEPYPSILEAEFCLAEEALLSEAIASLKPVAMQLSPIAPPAPSTNTPSLASLSVQSMLSIATCYQDQPNGIIVLHQCDRPRPWSEAELEFVQELADQVGTAIAHATLFTASQSLATELQRANSSLLQKHRELEEARQQAEEVSRLKSEFLAKTSHELRTPLNGMIGFLKLIIEGMADDPKEQSEFIDEAYRSALHLLNIINDILDVAKIEAGKLHIELGPVKLEELLNDVEGFTRSQVHQKQLRFEIQRPPTDDEVILFGNYQRLLQVMLNVVGNAIKFTHEGGITISVEIIKKKMTFQNQEFPGVVKVRVDDTGIGVSLDKQDKLFQSFSQVDGSRTRQYEGTGLGLAISQKLVEAMGGEVNFFSLGEGLGSTVTFTVPLFQIPIMITSQSTDSGGDLRLSQTLYGH